jgi:hypothetical protein
LADVEMLLHRGQRFLFLFLVVEKAETLILLLAFEKLREYLRVDSFVILEGFVKLLKVE